MKIVCARAQIQPIKMKNKKKTQLYLIVDRKKAEKKRASHAMSEKKSKQMQTTERDV